MTLDYPTDGTAALRVSTGGTRPVLTVLPSLWVEEETDIEAIAFMDEAAAAMQRVINAEVARDVPSAYVINECGRIAHKAATAKAEVLRLRGGGPSAA